MSPPSPWSDTQDRAVDAWLRQELEARYATTLDEVLPAEMAALLDSLP